MGARSSMDLETWPGEWWLPGAPDARAPGDLEVIHHGALRLELGRYLSDGHADALYPIVLGTTRVGEPITLADVRQIGESSTYSVRLPEPHQRETLTADWAYIGAHLPTDDAQEFRHATIELTDLLIWAGASGFDESYGPEPTEMSISVARRTPLVVELPLGTLSLGHGWAVEGDGRRSRGIRKTVSFYIDLAESLDVPSILRRFGNPLRHLLTLATDRPNEIERLTVRTMRYDESHGTDVLVEYPRVGSGTNLPDTFGYDYLFDAESLGDRFSMVVAAWFDLYDRVRPALNLLFGPRFRPDTFTDNHFLNAVAAAEAYHRANIRNDVVPQDEHEARLASIDAASPAEHRAWLAERLRFSNEPTLRERLADLHSRVAGIVSGVIGSADEYSVPVVRARNALTHRGKLDNAPEIPGRDLFRLTEQTTFLLTANLLLDLGFQDIEIVEATRRSRRFRLLTEVLGPRQ